MSSIDQLEVLLEHDRKKRLNVSEDEADIPRNVILESRYSPESEITEVFRTRLLNHMIQFHTRYKVSEFTILNAYFLLESGMTKMSMLRQDLEKISMTILFILMKFDGEWSGRLEQYCQLGSNVTAKELLLMEKQVLMSLDYRLKVTSPCDVIFLISKVSGELSETAGSYY